MYVSFKAQTLRTRQFSFMASFILEVPVSELNSVNFKFSKSIQFGLTKVTLESKIWNLKS